MFAYLVRSLCLFFLLLFSSFSAKAVEPKVDFNGDGMADIFLQNNFTGDVAAWLIGGSGVFYNAPYGTVAPSTGWRPLGISDFNGDARTDLLWGNSFTGELYVWLINGGNVLQVGSLATVSPASGWTPIDLKDFNGDGRADVLWRNSNSGELYVWLINGTYILQSGSLGAVSPASGWMPIDLKDFNGDSRTDVFWRNSITGELFVWLVNGAYTYQMGSLGTVNPNSGWLPIDNKDFNGDGRADVFWYKNNTGEFYVWLIDGINVLQAGTVGQEDPNSHSGWVPLGTDDFNGDGRADLFWRNTYTEQTRAWLMNGSGIPLKKSYNNVPASSLWQVQIPR